MLNIILTALTVMSMLLIIYHHAVYPILLRWFAEKKRQAQDNDKKEINKKICAQTSLPDITVVIPAYNEARWIAEKIRNLAALDYPKEKYHVIIACDGCSDNTVDIAETTAREYACQDTQIEIRNFQKNRGKVAVINEVISESTSDLIVLSDVSALLSIDSLSIAAHCFKDDSVGVVNSHYQLWNPGSKSETLYWNYQSHIKKNEAELGAVLGAHGAFYIFRRQLFTPLAADTINDDFILPMDIVAKGYRSIQKNTIISLEMEVSNAQMDFKRRVRISAGNIQQAIRLKHLLHPKYGFVAFNFASGKVLRSLIPYCLLLSLAGSLILGLQSPFFLFLSMAQIGIYGLALLQLLIKQPVNHRLIKLIVYLVSGHTAGLIGSLRYLFKLEKGRWRRVTINNE